MRIGMGYDVHRLVEGRKLILCGVEIPYEKDCSDIPMQMWHYMRSWMHCSGQRHSGISASTFRTLIKV